MIDVRGISYYNDIPDSFMSRSPAVLKVILAVLVSICVALVNSFPIQLFLLAYAIVLALISRVPMIALLKRLALIDGFVLTLWLTLPFFCEDGVRTAAIITVRVHAAILAFISLLQTTSMPEILEALDQLHFPRKLIVLLHFTYRYIHVLADEAIKIYQSMTLRGFEPSIKFSALRTYGNLVGILVVKGTMRSQRVYNAMLLRGFNGSYPFFAPRCRHSFSDILKMVTLYALFLGCLMV